MAKGEISRWIGVVVVLLRVFGTDSVIALYPCVGGDFYLS